MRRGPTATAHIQPIVADAVGRKVPRRGNRRSAGGSQKQAALPLDPGQGSPATVFITVGPTANFTLRADLLFTGVLKRHPKLRFLSVEAKTGWIGCLLQRADEVFHKHRRAVL